MKKININTFLIVASLISCFLTANSRVIYKQVRKNQSLINDVYRNIIVNYVDDIDLDAFTKMSINNMLSAIFLIIHSILLGVKFDIQIYKLFRRVVLLFFIIFEIIAQGILVYHFYKLKSKLEKLINKKILVLKIILVSVLASVAILSLPILVTKGNTHFKHALEWNYFVGVVLFYLLSRFFWKRTP